MVANWLTYLYKRRRGNPAPAKILGMTMAHELSFTNGRAEMAFVGDTPWHGYGQQLQAGASIEEWIEAAGMAWRIQKAKVRFATAHSQSADDFQTFPDRYVLLRSDNKHGLGIVSDQYEVVQPSSVLEFFRDLTEEAGFTLHTAGVLFDGRKFWALAETGESAAIADARDRVKGYLLLSTTCDGTGATEARYTSIRVVCNNTLSYANRAAANFKCSHKLAFDHATAKKALGIELAHDAFQSTMDTFRLLAETPMSHERMIEATVKLFNPKLTADSAIEEYKKALDTKPVRRVVELASGAARGSQFAGTVGTAWGWLNGLTEYVDHEARARGTDAERQQNRLDSALWGRGDKLKQDALQLVTSLPEFTA